MRARHVLAHMGLALLGFTLWSVADALIHTMAGRPPLAVIFWASMPALLALVVLAPKLGGLRATFAAPRQDLQWARGAALAASAILGIYAFICLPLSTTYALVFVQPFCAKVLSAFLLGERPSPSAWASSALGFFGILLILRPGFVPVSPAALAALGSALFFALGYVLTRLIGQENQTPLGTALYRYLIGVPVLPLLAGGVEPLALPLRDVPWAAAAGVLGVAGVLAVSRAYAAAPTALIAPVHYTQVLWGTAFGALFFGETPDAWTMTGGAVIIGSGLWLVVKAHESQEPP